MGHCVVGGMLVGLLSAMGSFNVGAQQTPPPEAALRLRASAELQQMEPALAIGDRLLQAGTWLRRNPVYLIGALAVPELWIVTNSR